MLPVDLPPVESSRCQVPGALGPRCETRSLRRERLRCGRVSRIFLKRVKRCPCFPGLLGGTKRPSSDQGTREFTRFSPPRTSGVRSYAPATPRHSPQHSPQQSPKHWTRRSARSLTKALRQPAFKQQQRDGCNDAALCLTTEFDYFPGVLACAPNLCPISFPASFPAHCC